MLIKFIYLCLFQNIVFYLLTSARIEARRSLNIALDFFLHMEACSISLLWTFYICWDRRFVTIPANIKTDDPGKYKKKTTYYKLCYKQIKVYFIFISIKNFHKA